MGWGVGGRGRRRMGGGLRDWVRERERERQGKKGCRIQKWRVVRGIWGGISPERFIPPRGEGGRKPVENDGEAKPRRSSSELLLCEDFDMRSSVRSN